MNVLGRAQLRELELRFKTAGSTVDAEVAKDLRVKVVPALTPIFRGEALTHMPKRMGYAALLASSTEAVATVRAKVGMTVRVFAKGKKEGRDVPTLNRGLLRHPLFGNRRFWYGQRSGVRKGFVDDGGDKAFDLVGDTVRDALHRVGRKVVEL